MKIIWCIVPEIWSAMDSIIYHFGHFGTFFALPPLPFITTWKIKILKEKKTLEILSFYTYALKITIIQCMFPWDKECDRQNFLPFWAIFCSFTTLTTWKIKNFEKMKKWRKKKKNTWRYYHFTNVYQKWQSNDEI